MHSSNSWLGKVLSGHVNKTAALICLIVGPVTVLLAQGKAIWSAAPFEVWPAALVVVACYVAAALGGAARQQPAEQPADSERPPEPADSEPEQIDSPEPQAALPEGAPAETDTALEEAEQLAETVRANATRVNSASKDRHALIGTIVEQSQNVIQEVVAIQQAAGENNAALKGAHSGSVHIAEQVGSLASEIDASQTLSRDAAEAIEQFNNDFKKIEEITRSIFGIAQQTNLLALNATIEAARAGEMGKGFAVVAGEVKALAHSSGQSASEIESLLNELAASASSVGETIGQLAGTLAEAAGTSAGARDEVKVITESIGQAAERADRTANQAADQVTEFEAVVKELETIKSDTEAAIKGSALNIELATSILQKIAVHRQRPPMDADATILRTGT